MSASDLSPARHRDRTQDGRRQLQLVREAGGDGGYGVFSWDRDTDRWRWSPEVYTVLGHDVGPEQPAAELLARYEDPDVGAWVGRVREAFGSGVRKFSSYEHVSTPRRSRRVVLVLAELDPEGRQVRGQLVDLTRQHRAAGTEAVQAASSSRDAISRAIGVLMLTHDLEPDAAHSLLVWHSQNHNVKVSVLARRVLEQLGQVPSGSDQRAALDRLLTEVTGSTARSSAAPPPVTPG